MTNRCFQCGRPATAGPHPQLPEESWCIQCAALTGISIPDNLERLGNVPSTIARGPAWPIAKGDAQGDALWLHQANALNELEGGNNIVVATSTASGKSLIFQLWTLHRLESAEERATALVFYPTKALANDQARRWKECCQAIGLDPNTVGQVDGDVPKQQRYVVMKQSRIILATPDICHSWMLPRVNDKIIKDFMAQLQVIIIDEAHTYESIFGSNSAYLFRRLTSAALHAGAPTPPRFIAATATILTPDEHLEKLTGAAFTVIEETQNGSPRQARELYHLPLVPRGDVPEDQLAQLVLDIIDNDPEAQVIAFHDSRMGIERIVQRINRPEEVLPYRSGYLAGDRRKIEARLRDNSIRGIIATSAMELGIDMPDLNYGINLGLPRSRKQFHQRLGRVGRSKPGSFIILAPETQFSAYGDTLQDYYENSVEPSQLYLNNEYINYQQAQCLRNELERRGQDSRMLPENIPWPDGFQEALHNAHGRPPAHLQGLNDGILDTQPQITNSLRSAGEETLHIVTQENGIKETIGYINVQSAMDEAYPGGIYHQQGISYQVEDWRRERKTMKPLIRAKLLKYPGGRTRPIKRQMATIPQDPNSTINRREMTRGHLAELRILLTKSVEGYKNTQDKPILYQYEVARDPRMSRKERNIPTTAVQLRIDEPWFAGGSGPAWQARHQIARALRQQLAYRKSIKLPDLGYQVENIIMETDQGFLELENSILVHDNIHGGMGLVQDLYQNIERYVRNLNVGTTNEQGTVYPEYANELTRWLERNRESQKEPLPGPPPKPGTRNCWRVARRGSEVMVFSKQRNCTVLGVVEKHEWQGAIVYLIKTDGETIEARDNQLSPAGAALDWQLWTPQTGRLQELQLIS